MRLEAVMEGAAEMDSEDLRVKVALLERDFKHMSEKFDQMAAQVADMHELLTQAKGARWAIITVVAIAGFVAGKVGAISSLFGVK